MPNWSLGRTGQVYVVEETAYDTVTTQLATTALRHLNITMHFDPKSLAKSPERHTHPSQVALYTRRFAANWGIKGQMYPSGVLNTLPEMTAILKNGLGAAPTNTTLATTVASGPTVTGATLTSGAGLAVGQFIELNIASGGFAGTYMRWLVSVAGAVVTWSPALPAAQLVGDTAKGCVTYSLGTALPKSLDICHYPQAPSTWYNREHLGAVIEKLQLAFDSNLEPMFDASGPSCEQVAAQAQPGSFTTVGAENAIPSGLTGQFLFNGTVYQIEKMQVDLSNVMELQNTAFGTAKAVGFFRKGKRAVVIKVNAKVSDDLTLWTPSLVPSAGTLLLQCGTTSGRIWAIYCAIAQLMRPADTPDADETNNWDYEITPLGSLGNDEVYLGQG